MATITVRGLDDETVRALKVRAAQAGRSMEAEVREILADAVRGHGDEYGFGTMLRERFRGLGPLDIPPRTDMGRTVDLS
ncbi:MULTISPECIES: FitA-like ribbon-helix-helix domain-containing protein [unclassified Microbacterium]|uniref:FitA-like ribbon-helix-helix domain-containing protein n=1 Tax=unclassified Microbacterium TaxID=2609290 RepID=UPI0022F1327E|nr:plasmid stabilization protein [Streptomyces sp. MS2A]